MLVVRARSIHLFPDPVLHDVPLTYTPLARHSFGWIDSVSVTGRSEPSTPLTILLRGESDDPWSSGLHSLDFYTLQPGDASLPYVFPPTLVSQVQAVRGSLRCREVVLGPCGTAVWIQPQDRTVGGLVPTDDAYPIQARHESLVVAAFPGPLEMLNDTAITRGRTLFTNSLNNWTSLDYNEELGRIVLSSSFGRIMALEL